MIDYILKNSSIIIEMREACNKIPKLGEERISRYVKRLKRYTVKAVGGGKNA